jgi:hypothetical protein
MMMSAYNRWRRRCFLLLFEHFTALRYVASSYNPHTTLIPASVTACSTGDHTKPFSTDRTDLLNALHPGCTTGASIQLLSLFVGKGNGIANSTGLIVTEVKFIHQIPYTSTSSPETTGQLEQRGLLELLNRHDR